MTGRGPPPPLRFSAASLYSSPSPSPPLTPNEDGAAIAVIAATMATVVALPITLWAVRTLLRWRDPEAAAVASPLCVRIRRAFHFRGLLPRLDLAQAFCSLLACVLWVWETSSYAGTPAPSRFDHQTNAQRAIRVMNWILTLVFTLDYAVRLTVAWDRLEFFWQPIALVDVVTIAAGWSNFGLYFLAAGNGSSGLRALVQVFSVLRIFRVLRIVRIVRLAPTTGIQRQIAMLIGTCLALVFCGASFFQLVERLADGEEVSLPIAMSWMVSLILGRAHIGYPGDASAWCTIVVGSLSVFLIPPRIVKVVQLWTESAERRYFRGSPKQKHVVVICGRMSLCRIRNILYQVFHPGRLASNRPSKLVIVSFRKLPRAAKYLLELPAFRKKCVFIHSAQLSDLDRADLKNASSAFILSPRRYHDAYSADIPILARCVAALKVNPSIRLFVQVFNEKSVENLKQLRWKKPHDLAISFPTLKMKLMGLGALCPGLPTLLTNLIIRYDDVFESTGSLSHHWQQEYCDGLKRALFASAVPFNLLGLRTKDAARVIQRECRGALLLAVIPAGDGVYQSSNEFKVVLASEYTLPLKRGDQISVVGYDPTVFKAIRRLKLDKELPRYKHPVLLAGSPSPHPRPRPAGSELHVPLLAGNKIKASINGGDDSRGSVAVIEQHDRRGGGVVQEADSSSVPHLRPKRRNKTPPASLSSSSMLPRLPILHHSETPRASEGPRAAQLLPVFSDLFDDVDVDDARDEVLAILERYCRMRHTPKSSGGGAKEADSNGAHHPLGQEPGLAASTARRNDEQPSNGAALESKASREEKESGDDFGRVTHSVSTRLVAPGGLVVVCFLGGSKGDAMQIDLNPLLRILLGDRGQVDQVNILSQKRPMIDRAHDSRVSLISGSPLESDDLEAAGIRRAKSAIVLTDATSKLDETYDGDELMLDTEVIVTMNKINILRPVGNPIHTMAEFVDGSNVKYLWASSQTALSSAVVSGRKFQEESWMMSQSRLFMDPYYAGGSM